jgi:hypothetical protein
MLDILLILRFSLGIYFKVEISTIHFRNYFITFNYCWNFGVTFVLLELLLNWGVILECEDTFVIVELLLNWGITAGIVGLLLWIFNLEFWS